MRLWSISVSDVIYPYDNLEYYDEGNTSGQGCIYVLSSDVEEKEKYLVNKDGVPFKEETKRKIGFV